MLFWVAWWNLAPSGSIPHGTWVIPLCSVSCLLLTQQSCWLWGYCHGATVPVLMWPLFYLIMAPNHKSADARNSDMLKRSCKELPLSEKVKVLNKERKKSYAKLAKTVRMNLLSMKLWRRQKKFGLVLLLHLKLQKIQPQGMTNASLRRKGH